MSEIPEDIRLAARDVSHRMYLNVDDDGRAYLYDEDVDEIARALFAERLAERERCAKVVEAETLRWEGRNVDALFACGRIVDAIRRGDTP